MIRCFTILIYDQFVFFDSVHHMAGGRWFINSFFMKSI